MTSFHFEVFMLIVCMVGITMSVLAMTKNNSNKD